MFILQKNKTSSYLKYHYLHPNNYLGFKEKDIEIRKRYEEHHKLGFNLSLAFFLAFLAAVISLKDLLEHPTYGIATFILGIIIASSLLFWEIVAIMYHQETTRMMKKNK